MALRLVTVAYGKCQLISAQSLSTSVPNAAHYIYTVKLTLLSFSVANLYTVRQKDWIKRYQSKYSNDHKTDWNLNSSPSSSYGLVQPFFPVRRRVKLRTSTVSSLRVPVYVVCPRSTGRELDSAAGRHVAAAFKALTWSYLCVPRRTVTAVSFTKREVEGMCERCCVVRSYMTC